MAMMDPMTRANGTTTTRNTSQVENSARYRAEVSDSAERPHQLNELVQHGLNENHPYQFSRSSSFRLEQSGSGGRPTLEVPHESTCQARDVDYDTVDKRLASYTNYPSDANAAPQDLAENGLYYVGQGDKVKCAYCRGQMYNWEEGDSAFSEHLQHFSRCHFIMTKDRRQKWEAAERSRQNTEQVNRERIQVGIDRERREEVVVRTDQREEVTARTDDQREDMTVRTDDHSRRETQDSNSRSGRDGERQDDIAMSMSVKVTIDMGLEESLVKKAFHYLIRKKQKSARDIKSAELIDVVSDMEDHPDKYSEERDETDQAIAADHALESRRAATSRDTPATGASTRAPTREPAQFAAGNLAPTGTFNTAQHQQHPSMVTDHHQIARERNEQVQAVGAHNNSTSSNQGNYRQLVAKGMRSQAAGNNSDGNTNNMTGLLDNQSVNRDVVDSALCSTGNLPDRENNDSLSRKTSEASATGAEGGESSENILKLKDEQLRLRQNVVCNICHRNKINILFLPCRHLVACENCSEMKDCARCDKEIIATVKIFLV